MMAQAPTSPSFTLSRADQQRFDTMGFLAFRRLFSAGEMADIDAGFARAMSAVARKHGTCDQGKLIVVPFIEADEVFHRVFDDDRVMGIVEGVLGEDCLYYGGSNGNAFVGNTKWHSDSGNPYYGVAKIAFYLDPVGPDSGCLSVIPGSHRPEFHNSLRRAFGAGIYDVQVPEVPGRYPVVSEPGDVVVFHHALYHSAWGGVAGRRMFAINYAAQPAPGWETTYFSGLVDKQTPWKRGLRLFSDRLVQTAGPRRMNKLRTLIDMGYCDPSRTPLSESTLIHFT